MFNKQNYDECMVLIKKNDECMACSNFGSLKYKCAE